MRTIVVFPAPLGPSSAKIVPGSTVRLTSSRTTWSPNDLHTPRATIPLVASRFASSLLLPSSLVIWVRYRRRAPGSPAC